MISVLVIEAGKVMSLKTPPSGMPLPAWPLGCSLQTTPQRRPVLQVEALSLKIIV